MMRRLTAFFILTIIGISGFAQSKKESMELGNASYENRQYSSAIYYYLKVLGSNTLNTGEITYPYEIKSVAIKAKDVESTSKKDSSKTTEDSEESYVINILADCYRLNKNFKKAEIWYAKSLNNKNSNFPYVRFWYADALMKNEKYGDALNQLETFITEFTNTEDPYFVRAQQYIVSCNKAIDAGEPRKDIAVYELDSTFNSGVSNFAINFHGNEKTLVFSSAREGNTSSEEIDYPANYASDLYLVDKENNGFGVPTKFGPPLNSGNNEGCGSMSLDRQTFYFTRWSPFAPNECAIYVSKYFNNQWMQPLKLNNNVNVEGYQSMHPFLSLDGTLLFFSSNRPDGYGGYDIWYCTVDDFGNVGPAKNAGNIVNTAGDEVTPFYQYIGKTLYFSSDGHETMGGLDVMRSTFNDYDSVWTNAENLGEPINSSKDETFYIISEDQSFGFLTSNKAECASCIDEEYKDLTTGYCNKVYTFTKNPMKFAINGTVYNAETNDIIPNALVTFKDIKGVRDPIFLTTDENGYYEKELGYNEEWFIKAQKKGFFGDAASVSTVGLAESKTFIQDFFLSPIPEGEIAIEGIEYDFDKATLRPKSKEVLDNLIEFLKLNDNIIVEIASHTDSRGNDKYNLKLSQERAKSVVNYLIANGIATERMIAKGYGETKPLEDCSKYPECGDTRNDECACHQKNRRTAFTTISEDYKYNLKTE